MICGVVPRGWKRGGRQADLLVAGEAPLEFLLLALEVGNLAAQLLIVGFERRVAALDDLYCAHMPSRHAHPKARGM